MKNSLVHTSSRIYAISSVDGRSFEKVKEITVYMSEYALFKFRTTIELHFLLLLADLKIIKLRSNDKKNILNIGNSFTENDFNKIKAIEKEINHDVKAVEFSLQEKLNDLGLSKLNSFIHIGLTSEDINNLAYAQMLTQVKKKIIEPNLEMILQVLYKKIQMYKNEPFLARTHGQPAVPTTIGKEFATYYKRLKKRVHKLKQFNFEGKINGAVGNHNALYFTLPHINWIDVSKSFVQQFGLTPNIYTTQILPYDNVIEFFQIITLINGVLLDLSINMWHYIMLEIFVQKKKNKEVGSSTMPQKINPINFENAEGNLQMANSMYSFFTQKLIHSRLQRDLSDSTIRRNFGEAISYSLIAWKSVCEGLLKIDVNHIHNLKELDSHYEVLTEAIQTYLRTQKTKNPFGQIKQLTRGKTMTKNDFILLLRNLKIDSKHGLFKLRPDSYLGYAVSLSKQVK